jgi:Phosphoenolpyruvate carboxylase
LLNNRRRNKLIKRDFSHEGSAPTESDIEETLKRLVTDLKKSPQEVFDALKSQTIDLVFTAHPTQSIRRSLLQKHARFEFMISLPEIKLCIFLVLNPSMLGSVTVFNLVLIERYYIRFLTQDKGLLVRVLCQRHLYK